MPLDIDSIYTNNDETLDMIYYRQGNKFCDFTGVLDNGSFMQHTLRVYYC